jgi:hypothetical protein
MDDFSFEDDLFETKTKQTPEIAASHPARIEDKLVIFFCNVFN